MKQEREQISPNRHKAEAEVVLTSSKSVKPKMELTDVDDLLSKNAEEFLKRNQQKGGQ